MLYVYDIFRSDTEGRTCIYPSAEIWLCGHLDGMADRMDRRNDILTVLL